MTYVNRDRSWRRMQNNKAKFKAFRSFKSSYYSSAFETNDDINNKCMIKAAFEYDTMARCSCWMCRCSGQKNRDKFKKDDLNTINEFFIYYNN